MAKDWDSVRIDVCRLYAGGKSLSKVRKIIQQERGFTASVRSYRKKIEEWKARRIDKLENFQPLCPTPAEALLTEAYDQFAADLHSTSSNDGTPTEYDPDQIAGLQARIGADDNHAMELLHASASPIQLARDEKFDHVLQRMYEAPSTCLLSGFLKKEDFYSKGSTLLHYISARGRMSNALSDAMIFCTFLGHSLDILDSNRLTALHIAVRYDRIENVLPLLTYGATFNTPNPDGELPLHVAVTHSKDENLVKKLLWCRGDVMDTQVVAPSIRAGQVVLDLMVERVLREMMHSGKAEVSSTTKEIFSAILTVRYTVTDTVHLRKHAQANYHLFLQATLAIGNLSGGKGGRLGLTMMNVLREVCKENGWEIPEDAQYSRILPFAWQSTNSKVYVSLSY